MIRNREKGLVMSSSMDHVIEKKKSELSVEGCHMS